MVITTVIEMVEILDGRLGKRSVERVRYVINNLLHLVIVKYGDWTVIGKYTASSSVVNATLVYKPFNLATPIAGLQGYDWVKKTFSSCL